MPPPPPPPIKISLMYVCMYVCNMYVGSLCSLCMYVPAPTCPEPPAVAHASVAADGEGRRPGDRVYYQCQYGYIMNHKRFIKCKRNFKWTTNVECVQDVTRKFPGCMLLFLSSSRATSKIGFVHKTWIYSSYYMTMFLCCFLLCFLCLSSGLHSSSSYYMTMFLCCFLLCFLCLSSGLHSSSSYYMTMFLCCFLCFTWAAPPPCVFVVFWVFLCVYQVGCTAPPDIPFARYRRKPGAKYAIGAKLLYYCMPGYSMSGFPNIIKCLASEQWSNTRITCSREYDSDLLHDPNIRLY